MKSGRRKAESGRQTGIARSPFALPALLMGTMCMSGASAWAQITVDPTRPPTLVAVPAPEGAAPANQLQSVMISPTRRAAIINGSLVELGAKYGDAVLMRVAEDEVVLRSGSSQQVLKLHPAVERVDAARVKPAAPAAAKSPPGKAKAKAKSKAEAKAKAQAAGPGTTDATAGRNSGTR